MPAHCFVDDGDRVSLAFAGLRERRNRSAEQAHELADVTGRCLVALLLAAFGAGEQGTDKLVEHLDRGVRQPRLGVDQVRDERRLAPAGCIIGKQEGRRRGALTYELPEAMLVDGVCDVGGDADRAHKGEPLEDTVDIRRRRRLRDVAQPGERGGVELSVVEEKRVDTVELFGRQRRDESFGRPPSGTGASGQACPLDRIGRRQDELGGAQALDEPARNRLALVGRPRSRGREVESERHVGVGEGAEPEMGGDLSRMIESSLRTAAVVAKRRRRDAELVGEVAEQRLGHRFASAQAEARMAQQAKLDRETEAVMAAAPVGRKLEIDG